MVIGITGSISSGKTYCLKQLCKSAEQKSISFLCINIDDVRREILKENLEIATLYKQSYFSKSNMKKYKDAIVPNLKEYIKNQINTNKDKLIFIEWALLIEDNLLDFCDVVLMVNSKRSTQKKRLLNGDLSPKQISKRLHFQFSNRKKMRKLKRRKKDLIIFNTDNNPEDKEYESLFNEILNRNNDYSFCLFKIPKSGGRVLWEVTNVCNYCCSYCIFSCSPKKIENELNKDDFKRILKELKENGFSYIKFTGGEPFVRKDMIEILSYAKKLKFEMDISTNASLIDLKMARKLAKLKLNYVHVSLDGYDKESQEMIRGENTFERTIRGIKNLTSSNVYTRIGTVIYKNNQNNLEQIVMLAEKLGANEIIFSFMEAVGRLEGDDTLVSDLKIDEVVKNLKGLAQKYEERIKVTYSFTEHNNNQTSLTRCPALQKFIYINNLGQISPCTWVTEKNKNYMSEISLKENSYKKVLSSKQLKHFIEDFSECPNGVCPVARREQ